MTAHYPRPLLFFISTMYFALPSLVPHVFNDSNIPMARAPLYLEHPHVLDTWLDYASVLLVSCYRSCMLVTIVAHLPAPATRFDNLCTTNLCLRHWTSAEDGTYFFDGQKGSTSCLRLEASALALLQRLNTCPEVSDRLLSNVSEEDSQYFSFYYATTKYLELHDSSEPISLI